MSNVSLAFVPGRRYKECNSLPGSLDERFNIHSIYGFNTIAKANTKGVHLHSIGIAERWQVNGTGRGICWRSENRHPVTGRKILRDSHLLRKDIEPQPGAAKHFCPYGHNHELYRLSYRPCEFCSWITARDLIFDHIGDRPVEQTTATPAIDLNGNAYGWHCHSGNHVWSHIEDARKCCSKKHIRVIGRWIQKSGPEAQS